MDTSSFKIAVDRRTGKVVHVDHVEEGFQFATCPGCRSDLITANRNPFTRRRDTYFRHGFANNCGHETLVHLWAKQVVAEHMWLRAPKYTSVGKAKDSLNTTHFHEIVQGLQDLKFQQCELERPVHTKDESRIPDVIGRMEAGFEICVEIFVTNAVDSAKATFYTRANKSCLEIDLSSLPLQTLDSPEAFEKYVLAEAPRKWIHCNLYSNADAAAQIEAEKKANLSNEAIQRGREALRESKKMWRDKNKVFIELIEAYLDKDKQNQVQSIYEQHLNRNGTRSFLTRRTIEAQFGCVPKIVNAPVKGELSFHCHRSAWQWEIYQRLVIDGLEQGQKAMRSARTSWSTRGYQESMRMVAWYNHVPRWSAERLYGELTRTGIRVNRICSEAEAIVGQPILQERERPDELVGLKVKEWREMPKPVCVIRRYLRILADASIVETIGNDYLVRRDAKLP